MMTVIRYISRNKKWNWKRWQNQSRTRENDYLYMIVISTKQFILHGLCNDLLNFCIFLLANCERHMSKSLTNSHCFIKVLASICWKSLTFVGINSRQILKLKNCNVFVIIWLYLYLSKYKAIRLWEHYYYLHVLGLLLADYRNILGWLIL